MAGSREQFLKDLGIDVSGELHRLNELLEAARVRSIDSGTTRVCLSRLDDFHPAVVRLFAQLLSGEGWTPQIFTRGTSKRIAELALD